MNTETAAKPDVPQPPAPSEPLTKRLGNFFWRALTGAAIGGIFGYFLVKGDISGAAIGGVLGWYLARGIWGVVGGLVFGWFLIDGNSGAVAGMVAGVMISCNIVGRKGRWIVLAVVVVLTLVSLFTHETSRQYVLRFWHYLLGVVGV